MFCSACGARNPDDAKFCNQCGVRLDAMAPVVDGTTSHGSVQVVPPPLVPSGGNTLGGVPAKNPTPTTHTGDAASNRIPTLGGSGDAVELPMVGPSRKSLAIGAAALLVVGVVVGGVVARSSARETTPSEPTLVGLVEAPRQLLPLHDAGSADASIPLPTVTTARSRPTGRTPTARTTPDTPTTEPPTNNPPAPTANARNSRSDAGNTARVANNGTTPRTTPGSTPPTENGTTPPETQPNGPETPSETNNPPEQTEDAAAPLAALPPEAPSGSPGPRAPAVGGFREGEATDATGTMDPRVFTFVYRHFRSQIASCHSGVSRGREVSGIVRLRVRIGTNGHVARTTVISNSTGSEELAQCIQEQVQRWRYPQPEGGEVDVEYPFAFGQ